MPTPEAPFSKREQTTLRQIKNDPQYKGWYVKAIDEEGPFVVPVNMFFSGYGENDPRLDEEQVAYFNEQGTVVLLWSGYSFSPVVTLLNWTAALDYLYCSDTLVE